MHQEIMPKNILLTGVNGTLGRETLLALLRKGHRVWGVDLASRSDVKLGAECAHNYNYISCDISDEPAVVAMFDEILHETKSLDCVVNGAAVTGELLLAAEGDPFADLIDYSLDQWRKVMSVNLDAPFLVAKHAEKFLREGRSAVLINISSIYGFIAPDHRIYEGEPFSSVVSYAASKAGIHGLTLWLSSYWRDLGIRCNTLVPGGVNNGHSEIFSSSYASKTLAQRMATPEDIVQPLLFLLSDEARYMNGQKLIVDGGFISSA